jgi:hypothetical protein
LNFGDHRLQAKHAADKAGHQAIKRLFGRAASAEPSAPVSLAQVHLSSFGSGADTMTRFAPETVTKKAAPAPLHPIAQKLASRFGEDAATLISEVAKRSEAAGGAAVDMTSLDVSRLLNVPEPRARAIMDALLSAGALITRRHPVGGRAGYIASADLA